MSASRRRKTGNVNSWQLTVGRSYCQLPRKLCTSSRIVIPSVESRDLGGWKARSACHPPPGSLDSTLGMTALCRGSLTVHGQLARRKRNRQLKVRIHRIAVQRAGSEGPALQRVHDRLIERRKGAAHDFRIAQISVLVDDAVHFDDAADAVRE